MVAWRVIFHQRVMIRTVCMIIMISGSSKLEHTRNGFQFSHWCMWMAEYLSSAPQSSLGTHLEVVLLGRHLNRECAYRCTLASCDMKWLKTLASKCFCNNSPAVRVWILSSIQDWNSGSRVQHAWWVSTAPKVFGLDCSRQSSTCNICARWLTIATKAIGIDCSRQSSTCNVFALHSIPFRVGTKPESDASVIAWIGIAVWFGIRNSMSKISIFTNLITLTRTLDVHLTPLPLDTQA